MGIHMQNERPLALYIAQLADDRKGYLDEFDACKLTQRSRIAQIKKEIQKIDSIYGMLSAVHLPNKFSCTPNLRYLYTNIDPELTKSSLIYLDLAYDFVGDYKGFNGIESYKVHITPNFHGFSFKFQGRGSEKFFQDTERILTRRLKTMVVVINRRNMVLDGNMKKVVSGRGKIGENRGSSSSSSAS